MISPMNPDGTRIDPNVYAQMINGPNVRAASNKILNNGGVSPLQYNPQPMTSDNPIDIQQSASDRAGQMYTDMYNRQESNLSPFMRSGQTALQGLASTANRTYGDANLTGLSSLNPNVSANFSAGHVNPTIGGGYGGYSNVHQNFTDGQVTQNYDDIINDPLYQFANKNAQEMANRNLARQGLSSSHAAGVLGDVGMNTAYNASDRLWNRDVGNENRLFQSQQAQANLGLGNAQNSLQAMGQKLAAEQARYGQMSDNANRDYQSQLANYQVGADNYNRAFNQGSTLFNLANQQGQSQYNKLMGLAQLGQNTAVNLANSGAGYANAMGNNLTGIANAQAGSILANDSINANERADNKAMWAGLAGTGLANIDKIAGLF